MSRAGLLGGLGVSKSAGPLAWLGYQYSGSAIPNYTFSNIYFGPPDENRWLIIGTSHRANSSRYVQEIRLNSSTGLLGAEVGRIMNGLYGAAIWYINTSAVGETGSIYIKGNSTLTNVGFGLWRGVGTPVVEDFKTTLVGSDLGVNTSPGDVVIGSARLGGTYDPIWSGLTLEDTGVLRRTISMASATRTIAESPRAISCDHDYTAPAFVVASLSGLS